VSTFVYDGDCGFCTTSVHLMQRLRMLPGDVIPWQHADLDALGLTSEQCMQAAQWVDAGEHRSGHLAFAEALRRRGPWKPLGLLLQAPGVSWLAARLYDWIAAHRMSLPGGTPACKVPASE